MWMPLHVSNRSYWQPQFLRALCGTFSIVLTAAERVVDLIDDTPANLHTLFSTKDLKPLVSNHEDGQWQCHRLSFEQANDNKTDKYPAQ